jgi:hypothetical protein
MDKPVPLLSIRPRFDQPLTMVYAGIATLLGTLVVTLVGGIFIYFLLVILGLARFIAVGYVFGLLLVSCLIAIPVLFFDLRRKSLTRTVFNFYESHLEYQFFHFHLNRRRGRLRYRDITDINQRATALQEQRGLTTVYVYTNAPGYQRSDFSGLEIVDLPLLRDDMSQIIRLLEQEEKKRFDVAAASAASSPVPEAPPVIPSADDSLPLQ